MHWINELLCRGGGDPRPLNIWRQNDKKVMETNKGYVFIVVGNKLKRAVAAGAKDSTSDSKCLTSDAIYGNI